MYNVSGGSLSAETVVVGSGEFNMTGGTFSATNFMGDLTQGGGTLSPVTMTVTANDEDFDFDGLPDDVFEFV